MKSKIGVAIVIILIALQFVPADERSTPSFEPASDMLVVLEADAELASIIKDACYDCHSYESEYPWYATIAPISWWLDGHIEHGRGEMNFSTWGTMIADDQKHALKESAEKVEKKEMPLTPFLITHPEARITEEQRAQIAGWMRSKM
jgi:hypothetical protein